MRKSVICKIRFLSTAYIQMLVIPKCARNYRYNQDSNEEEIVLQKPVQRSLESSACTFCSDPVLQREDISEETG